MFDHNQQMRIENTCKKIVNEFLEDIKNQSVFFEVQYESAIGVFEVKDERTSFADIKPNIAEYFSMPQ